MLKIKQVDTKTSSFPSYFTRVLLLSCPWLCLNVFYLTGETLYNSVPLSMTSQLFIWWCHIIVHGVSIHVMEIGINYTSLHNRA